MNALNTVCCPMTALFLALVLAAGPRGLCAGERSHGVERRAGPGFFREYWAEKDEQRNNSDWLLRVNDPGGSLHEWIGRRREGRANGLLLVEVPEDLYRLEAAELYLELWGGHPHTANKRFRLNGRHAYPLPEVGSAAGHCTFSYPRVPLRVADLVRGWNAFQFACDRGESFWGHYIVNNACVRAYLPADHPDLAEAGLDGFAAGVDAPSAMGEQVRVGLHAPGTGRDAVERVDYFARYYGFDDDGDTEELEWHGFTQHRRPVNHVGSADEAPFAVTWDTTMVPTPPKGQSVQVRAVVRLRQGFNYLTHAEALPVPEDRPPVRLFTPAEMPTPMWSRDGRTRTAAIDLPDDLDGVERALLLVKVWDGGEGGVEAPFTINGHAYDVVSGRAVHDVVFTRAEVDPAHLRPGRNELRVLSDTEHHGIEVLRPGPCLVLRFAG